MTSKLPKAEIRDPSLGTCDLCRAKDKELRPYGPRGENICFKCGMKDEKTTGRQFMRAVFWEQVN